MNMNIHVPSMLAKGVETNNKQTQQTSSHNGLAIRHHGLENLKYKNGDPECPVLRTGNVHVHKTH